MCEFAIDSTGEVHSVKDIRARSDELLGVHTYPNFAFEQAIAVMIHHLLPALVLALLIDIVIVSVRKTGFEGRLMDTRKWMRTIGALRLAEETYLMYI
jgi:hypothetical protein